MAEDNECQSVYVFYKEKMYDFMVKKLKEHSYCGNRHYKGINSKLLRHAILNNNREAVDALFEGGVSANNEGYYKVNRKEVNISDLELVYGLKKFDIFKLLIEKGANLNKLFEHYVKDEYPLSAITRYEDKEDLAVFMIQKGADVLNRKDGDSIMIPFFRKSWNSALEEAFKRGFSPDSKLVDNYDSCAYPVIETGIKGNTEGLKLIKKYGGKFDLRISFCNVLNEINLKENTDSKEEWLKIFLTSVELSETQKQDIVIDLMGYLNESLYEYLDKNFHHYKAAEFDEYSRQDAKKVLLAVLNLEDQSLRDKLYFDKGWKEYIQKIIGEEDFENIFLKKWGWIDSKDRYYFVQKYFKTPNNVCSTFLGLKDTNENEIKSMIEDKVIVKEDCYERVKDELLPNRRSTFPNGRGFLLNYEKHFGITSDLFSENEMNALVKKYVGSCSKGGVRFKILRDLMSRKFYECGFEQAWTYLTSSERAVNEIWKLNKEELKQFIELFDDDYILDQQKAYQVKEIHKLLARFSSLPFDTFFVDNRSYKRSYHYLKYGNSKCLDFRENTRNHSYIMNEVLEAECSYNKELFRVDYKQEPLDSPCSRSNAMKFFLEKKFRKTCFYITTSDLLSVRHFYIAPRITRGVDLYDLSVKLEFKDNDLHGLENVVLFTAYVDRIPKNFFNSLKELERLTLKTNKIPYTILGNAGSEARYYLNVDGEFKGNISPLLNEIEDRSNVRFRGKQIAP